MQASPELTAQADDKPAPHDERNRKVAGDDEFAEDAVFDRRPPAEQPGSSPNSGQEKTTGALTAEVIRELEKLRAEKAEQERLSELERQRAAQDREELLRRIENAERETRAKAAAAAADWTTILHEKERVLEALAEERASHKYQQQEAARKVERLHEETARHLHSQAQTREEEKKAGEELLRRVESAEQAQKSLALATQELDETRRILAAARADKTRCDEEHVAAIRAGESRLAESTRLVEMQRGEIGARQQEVEEIRREKAKLVEELARTRLETVAAVASTAGARDVSGRQNGEDVQNISASVRNEPVSSPSLAEGSDLATASRAIPETIEMLPTAEKAAFRQEQEDPSTGARKDTAAIPRSKFAIWKRRCFFGFFILFVGVGMALGVVAGYRTHKRKQVESSVEAARSAFARGDLAEASLSARRGLQIDENHLPACQLMAEIAEKGGDVRALSWRERAVALAPGSADELIAYASTALRFNQRSLAQAGLEKIEKWERHRADFQAVSGAAALAGGDQPAAERFYAEAVRLGPENPAYAIDLAAVQSRSADFFTKEAGRRVLSEMGEHPDVGGRALRSLTASHEAAREFSAALRVSRQLLAKGSPVFADEVVHLRLLRRTGDRRFGDALAALQIKATKPDVATVLVTWMNSEGLAAEAATWATKAFPDIVNTPGLRAATAVSLNGARDWPALLDFTKIGPWPEAEYGRQAYRARALREVGQSGLANAAWKNALVAASAESDALSWLAHMATEWNWPEEHEEALLATVSSSTKARTALHSLSRRYLAEQNTAGLRRLAARLMEVDPSDDEAQNDYAILSLLLEMDVPRSFRLAIELYNRHPDHPAYASTYAFALNYQGESEQALRILETLPAAKLEEPGLAAYYGMILVANQRPGEAVHFLQIARIAPLLREELLLVEKSLQEAGVAPATE